MRLGKLLGAPFGPQSVAAKAQGYYIIKTDAAPTNPRPTSPLWNTLTTRLSDGTGDDHTTEEAVSIAGLGTVGTIEVLIVPAALATWASYIMSLRYSVDAPTIRLLYDDGAAWQVWDNPTPTPHLSDTFEDFARNPADQLSPYLLLELTSTGGGIATDYAVSNLVPTFA